jgi:hypothetical protein
MPPEPASHDADLNALESSLAAMPLARPRLDRDRLMFEAGRASAGHAASRRPWLAAACLGAIALGQGIALINRPEPRVVERIVVHEPTPVPPPIEAKALPVLAPVQRPSSFLADTFLGGETPYQRLTGQVLRFGLDGLPPSPPTAWAAAETSPKSAREQLRNELRQAFEPGDPS